MLEPVCRYLRREPENPVVKGYHPMYSLQTRLIQQVNCPILLSSLKRCFNIIWVAFSHGNTMNCPPPEQIDSGPVHLHEEHLADKNVVIHPLDEDRFVLTGKQMIASCSLRVSLQTWFEELKAAREELVQWCLHEDRVGKIAAAYLIPRPSQLAIYIVSHQKQYDFELADQATSLVTNLIRNYQVGMFELIQIPEAEVTRFVDSGYAPVYDSSRPTHSAVEA